jgi:hypothetical protein
MTNTTLNTRFKLKYDTYANWTLDTVKTQTEKTNANLVLLEGEIGICALESKDQGAQTAPTVLFKVGDGINSFKNLKWASALAADVYDWAKKSGDEFKTWLDTEAKFATDEEVATAINAEKALREAADTLINEKIGGDYSKDNSVHKAIEELHASYASVRADVWAIQPQVGELFDHYENSSVRFSDDKLYVGRDSIAEIIFDCGNATDMIGDTNISVANNEAGGQTAEIG